MSTFRVDTIQKHDQVSAIDLPNRLKIGGNKFEQGYTSSATEPSNPDKGDLWWDSANNKLYRYVGDRFQLLDAAVPAVKDLRGITQGVFTSGGTSETITLAMPSGTVAGDIAILVVGGLNWGGLSSVTVTNGNFGSGTSYQWGYNASNTTQYLTQKYEDTSISSTLLSSGVILRNNDASTEYKLASLLTFTSDVSPLYSHAHINTTGTHTNGSSYFAQSATRPTGYASLSGGGIIEVQTTREGNRTYIDAVDSGTNYSELLGQVNRGGIYRQAVYKNYSTNGSGYGVPYYKYTYNGGTLYSSSSLIIAF